MPNPKGHEDSIKDSRFKAAWQSGPTRTIRVPIALAEVTLEYARRLDSGIEARDTSKLSGSESSAVTSQPRDTKIKPRSQTQNPVGSAITVEARDTKNLRSEAADLLNQLKAKRKKSSATLAGVEMLLELLEG